MFRFLFDIFMLAAVPVVLLTIAKLWFWNHMWNLRLRAQVGRKIVVQNMVRDYRGYEKYVAQTQSAQQQAEIDRLRTQVALMEEQQKLLKANGGGYRG